MKKTFVFVLLGFSMFVLCSAGFAPGSKIATVDLVNVRDSFYLFKQARMDYSNKVVACEKDLHKMIDEGRKVQDQLRLSLDNENNQMLSAEERHKYTTTNDELRLELQIRGENISNYVANTRFKLSDEWSRRGEDLMSKIRGVMDARAKKQGYAMVLDRTALSMTGYPTVLYASGENDLTEALIKELNSTAPTPPAPEAKGPADNPRGAKPTPQ